MQASSNSTRSTQSTPSQVHISLGERSYSIAIGSGLLGNESIFQHLPSASTALIVSNTTVAPIYAARLKVALEKHYPKVLLMAYIYSDPHR